MRYSNASIGLSKHTVEKPYAVKYSEKSLRMSFSSSTIRI